MKELICWLRPSRLEATLRAVASIARGEPTWSEVRGYGRQKERLEAYREGGTFSTFLPSVRLAFTVNDADLMAATEAVEAASRSGRIGDGKILILNVIDAISAS